MFDIGWSELLVIAVVAIVVVGPKDLPKLMRTFGHYAGKLRRAAADFQRQFDEAMRESELEEVREGDRERADEAAPLDLDAPSDKPVMLPKPATSTAAERPAKPKPPAKPPAQAAAQACRQGQDLPPRARRRRSALHERANPTGHDDIEATKAPLIEHLIELRQRLIWALLAVFVAFLVCFWFAKPIYNLLLWPYGWRAGTDAPIEMIYTAPQEFFFTQLKLALFGAVFLAFPVIASQIYKFVAPGLYQNERQAFLPFLIATPILFLSAPRWSISWSCRWR